MESTHRPAAAFALPPGLTAPEAGPRPSLSALWPVVQAIDSKCRGDFKVLAAGRIRESKGGRGASTDPVTPGDTAHGPVQLTVYVPKAWRDAHPRQYQALVQAAQQDLAGALGDTLEPPVQFSTGSADTMFGLKRVPRALALLSELAASGLDEVRTRLHERLVCVLKEPEVTKPVMHSSLHLPGLASPPGAGWQEPDEPDETDGPAQPVAAEPLQPAQGQAQASPPAPADGPGKAVPTPASRLYEAFKGRFAGADRKSSNLLATSTAAGPGGKTVNLLKAAGTRFSGHAFQAHDMGVRIDPQDPVLEAIAPSRVLHILFGDFNADAAAGGSHLHPHQYPYALDKLKPGVPDSYAWPIERRFWNARVGTEGAVIHSYFPRDFAANEILGMALEEWRKTRKEAVASPRAALSPGRTSFTFERERQGLTLRFKAVLDGQGKASGTGRIHALYPANTPANMINRLARTYASSLAAFDWKALRTLPQGEAYNRLADLLEARGPEVAALSAPTLERLHYHVDYIGCLLRVVYPERYVEPKDKL